ncbi:MAG TPA: DinB family protein [Puia sp.]|nr:DinB family protein [Puia sp.]
MENQQDLLLQIVFSNWDLQISRATGLFEALSTGPLQLEVAANRNTGVYLLGHLTAVNDSMLPLLYFGERLHPELDEIFVRNPDKALEKPPIPQLLEYWKEVNATLGAHFRSTDRNDWFRKHRTISEEDFLKEPHRNRINILINRTNHISYHLGQLRLLPSTVIS